MKKKAKALGKAKHNKKKAVKKKTASKRKAPAPVMQTQALVTVPIEKLMQPEKYQGKFTLIPTPFTEKQIMHLIAPTPKDVIKQRPAKGGGTWDYVPGWWVKKKLNFTFGWLYDFDILGERVDGDYITVKGKLTIKDTKGNTLVSKTDYGGAEIKYKKGTKQYLDFSNDFKAAATDALKRCAAQLGIGADLQAKTEHMTDSGGDAPTAPVAPRKSDAPVYVPQPARAVDSDEIDYIKALNNFLNKRGFNSDKQKEVCIARYTGLQVQMSQIKLLSAKAILNQLQKKLK